MFWNHSFLLELKANSQCFLWWLKLLSQLMFHLSSLQALSNIHLQPAFLSLVTFFCQPISNSKLGTWSTRIPSFRSWLWTSLTCSEPSCISQPSWNCIILGLSLSECCLFLIISIRRPKVLSVLFTLKSLLMAWSHIPTQLNKWNGIPCYVTEESITVNTSLYL